jgi:AcrR family transcriptional regulator
MATSRRTGTETSKTRATLLDVTERLMRDEGYAAVSSRRVASEAGVTAALIHYYFPILDDLFLAVFRRGAEANLERHARALESPQPLRALWDFSIEPAGTVLLEEFIALSNHRKEIRREIANYAKRFRHLQTELLTKRLQEYGIDPKEVPASVLLVLIASVSRSLVMEDELGMTVGHAETYEFVEHWLERLEGEPIAPRRPAARPSARTRRAPRAATPKRRSSA